MRNFLTNSVSLSVLLSIFTVFSARAGGSSDLAAKPDGSTAKTITKRMETDPTTPLKVTAALVAGSPSGVRANVDVPDGMALNQEGPFAITFDNFVTEKKTNSASKEAMDFVRKSAFVIGHKVDDKKPAEAKVTLFVCDNAHTWCRRIQRTASF